MDKKISFTFLINKSSGIPLYIQLYEYIKKEIVTKNFKSSYKLPSIREASQLLKLSKTTIENAYNQLVVEGYIDNELKKGYYINEIATYNYSRDFNNTIERKKEIYDESYVNNGVDKTSFNIDIWKKLYNRVLNYNMTNIYTNGAPQGEYNLRYEISAFVNNIRGGHTEPEQVIIGAGIQYLIGILAGILKDSHKSVAIESPGYKKAEYIFEDYNFKVKHIVCNNNFDVNSLKNSLCKLVYISPSHQYPTGSIMPINVRHELLKWASEINGFIIEDDYDGIIRYDGMPISCLQGLDRNDCVIYLGSFSKTLLPSLRISYMIIPKRLIPLYDKIKNKYTQSTSKIDQTVLSLFISEGHITKHLRRIRRIYKKKNTLIIDYINEKYSNLLEVVNSDSGFHLVLCSKTEKSTEQILNICKKNNIFIEIIKLKNKKLLFSLNYSGIDINNINNFIDKLVQSII